MPQYTGHRGMFATIAFLKQYFWWEGMTADAKDFVQHCDICQKYKRNYSQSNGLLLPLPTPSQPWDVIGIDFITGLPKTKRQHDAILVMIDHLTKMAHAVPCTKAITAKETARLFIQTVFRHHGMPRAIVSDRGTQFIAQFWQSLLNQLGTKLLLSTAFHPQTNGLTERVNGTLMEALRILSLEQVDDWDEWVVFAEFAYNNSIHSVTRQTPFYLNSGQEPRVPLSLLSALHIPINLENPSATREFTKLHRHLQQAQNAIIEAKRRMASQAKHRNKPSPYKTGDLVLLSTKNLKLKGYQFPKMAPLFVGPFRVEKVGPNTVYINVPGSVHPTFSINRIKRYYRGGRFKQNEHVLPAPHFQDGDNTVRLTLQSILQQRMSGPKQKIQQYLVSFEGYGPEHHSWMNGDQLKKLFGFRFTNKLREFRKSSINNDSSKGEGVS